ncbi:MAG TPA: glucose-1-phosphate adenylyltransferase [Planctomycetota bacterium]|nr:glucose-1-phosphate adenylyltransferase [Planctomycetota bacterium]HRR81041.1 glucose-1-phosphate adenylyltransferase [Planctomycetota bacterium]HRU04709.1 glucose-1-phosphate adenylyltransferase [Candidatus Brocadiia bacterium]
MSIITSHGPRLKVIAMILAGGQGERLYPLTRDRAKPAVPFGGTYRIIDFTLSNCINSGIRRVFVLTQYKSSSLDYHIHFAWNILSHELGEFIRCIPPQQRMSTSWYLGTADAIYQNIYTLEQERPHLTFILSGDHVYKMNYRAMLDAHLEKSADLTIACIPVPKEEAKRLGVAVVDRESRIIDFKEKAEDPPTLPGSPNLCLASMGVYLFNTPVLVREIIADAKRDSQHDFGKNIIPHMIKTHAVYAHDFKDENKKPQKYWRDIGTRDAYWEANLDLVEVDPLFNLYDDDWPIRTAPLQVPPAKTVFNEDGPQGRRGMVINSLISPGCIVSGGYVERSILSPSVRVEEGARVTESIIMDDCTIGRGCTIHRAIIDKGVHIPDGTVIGLDRAADAAAYTVTTKGIVVVPRGKQYA